MQKKLAELGYDQTRFTAHIDFKMRDFVRAEQKKHGLVTDGQPNAALMEKMGLKPTRRPLTWRLAFSASSRAMSRM